MGCCCCKSAKEDKVSLVQNNSKNETHSSVTCKIGKCGDNINVNNANNFYTLTGKGTALGSCYLECDTAYWEVRLGENPSGICIGIKRGDANLNSYLDATEDTDTKTPVESWYFKTSTELKKNDVVGIYWDQSALPMLSFSLNGIDVPDSAYLRVRPANNVIPAVSVRESSSCDVIFDGKYFLHNPKSHKFGMIISATSLI